MSDVLTIIHTFEAAQGDAPLPTSIPGSIATGLSLLCSRQARPGHNSPHDLAHLGVDLLRLEAGGSFPLHTHPGSHLLYVLRGAGTVTFAGNSYSTSPGDLCLIDAEIPHAVGAIDDHYLLAFGAPHIHLEDPTRMTLVGEAAFTT